MRALSYRTPLVLAQMSQGPRDDSALNLVYVALTVYALAGIALLGGWGNMGLPGKCLAFIFFPLHVFAPLLYKAVLAPFVSGGTEIVGNDGVKAVAVFLFKALCWIALIAFFTAMAVSGGR